MSEIGWRRRIPLVVVVIACVAGVVAAVSAGTRPATGLAFLQDGHWVAQPGSGQVFHIDGAAKSVDAQLGVPGIVRGSQVVQGKSSGFVVGDARIVEFGKSDLRVENTTPAPTDERPVAVEAAGGPYLVYREAGTIVRLGGNAKTIPAGDVLGKPVVTPDGTLWLHRVNTGVLCLLPTGADRISCPAAAPTGHSGALTTIGDNAVFVDTTSDVLRQVSTEGLREPADLGFDAARDVQVAPADAGGRVAILNPSEERLYLVDTAKPDSGQDERPVTVPLPEGKYRGPTASDGSVVLLDETHDTLLTYSGDGRQLGKMAIPNGTPDPRLFRGEDERVYVNGADGRQVLVIDHDGAISRVPVLGEDSGGNQPERREPPQLPQDDQQPERTPDREPSTPDREPSVLADRRSPEPQRPEPELPPEPAPASPPGMPPGLSATSRNNGALVTWNAASANGAPVTAYHVSWSSSTGSGDGLSTAGAATLAVLNGLNPGLTYTITVVAQNGAGGGTPATTRITMPRRPVVTVTRGEQEAHGEYCKEPDCAKMSVTMTGFEPDTEYHVQPFSTGKYDNNGGSYTTDENGDYDISAFHFGQVGEQVWVVVESPDGKQYESARYTWESE